MTQDTQIVTAEYREIQLGALSAASPRAVVERAVEVATELAKIVREKKLSRAISGREYVYVEGWTTLGAMLGVVPREVSTAEQENGDYCAVVELVRVSDGAVIGRGSAILGTDETAWANRPRYARRSMCVTRATGKAFRLTFSWVMKLAGYEPTPAEEMEPEAERPAKAIEPPNGKQTKLWARWHELLRETQALGMPVPTLDPAASDAEIVKAGKELGARLQAAKENAHVTPA